MARQRKRRQPAAPDPPTAPETPTRISKSQIRRSQAIESRKSKNQERLLIIGLLAVSFLTFANSLDGEFVYDDRLQIIKNPTITSLSNIPKMMTQSVWQFLNEADQAAAGPYYRPLFNIALIINYHFFGLNVVGWHLFSLLLHLLSVFLVYTLAQRWSLSREVSAAAALFFGVHPVHSESVAWVAALPDPLACVFILCSLILYERHYYGKSRNLIFITLSVFLAFLSFLSKEVAMVFPVFILVRELLERREVDTLISTFTRAAIRAAPFFAALAVYIAMRYAVLGFFSQTEPKSVGIPDLHVLLTIPSILLGYARLMFLPYPLAVIYDTGYVQSPNDLRFLSSLLLLSGIVVVSIWLIQWSAASRRALAFSLVFILPLLNLKAFRPEESLLHDRYLYLPSIGLSILIAIGLERLIRRFTEKPGLAYTVAAIVITILLVFLTVNQNRSWQNEESMINFALKVAPRRPFLHNYIGANHFLANRLTEAERAYREALTIDPQYYDSHSNLGDIGLRQQRWSEAEQSYLKAIEYGAPYAQTYYNLAVVRTRLGKLAESEAPLRKALEIQPTHADARYNLAWIFQQLGRLPEAEQEYRKTLEVKPTYLESRINLASVLNQQERINEALEQLEIARRSAPGHPVMLYTLGDVLMKALRYQEAITALKQLIVQEPSHRFAHTKIGLCYEQVGQLQEARLSFQKAVEVAPQEPFTKTAREHLAKL
jgi:tetratricopeptide (TPR) repeat protein